MTKGSGYAKTPAESSAILCPLKLTGVALAIIILWCQCCHVMKIVLNN